MSTRETSMSANPDRAPNGLSGLGMGIVREAEALDASLDRAFIALREIRGATMRLASPAQSNAAADPGAVVSVPEQLVRQLASEVRGISSSIYQILNEAGAPPAVDAAARKTADGFESVADKLNDELNALSSAAPMAPDAIARVVAECRSEAQGLQRRLSSPMGKLMSIMQLRDNMDQRSSHIVQGADIGMKAPESGQVFVEVCLGAQLRDMSVAVREGSEAVSGAGGTISTMTAKLRTQIGMALAGSMLPATTLALQLALESRADWSAFRPLDEADAAVESFVGDLWTDLMTTLAYQWTAHHSAVEGTTKVSELLDVSAGILAATTALDDEAKSMAQAAIRLDALTDSLETESAIAAGSDVREDPVWTALWDSYTVEAERAVHNTLLDRLAG